MGKHNLLALFVRLLESKTQALVTVSVSLEMVQSLCFIVLVLGRKVYTACGIILWENKFL